MEKQQTYFKWLAVAALIEWLLLRTFTRAAIHIPKSPMMISIYTAVNQIGQVTAAFVALLAFVLLLWVAWQMRPAVILPLALVCLALLNVLFLLAIPPTWLAMTYQLLAVTAVFLIACTVFWGRGPLPEVKRVWRETAVTLFPACALLTGLWVQLLPNLYTLLGWPGPPPLTSVFFNLGEVLVVSSVFVWWWWYGRSRSWQIWLAAFLPALFFVLSFQRDPALTGILTIWSTGLTLFLPWPVYTLALWLAGMTVLVNWHRRPALAYAVLLLTSAGYAPQLSSQLFCALIALWLLARPWSEPVQQRDVSWPLPIPYPVNQ